MTPLLELHRYKGTLLFARKVLTAAMLLQLPILLAIVLKQMELHLHLHRLAGWTMPGKLYWLLNAATSLLAIVGFTVVCRQLSLWEGDLENTELVQRTALLGTRKIAASVQLFFYLIFLLPLFNLIPIIWARSKASSAIAELGEATTPRQRR